MSNIHDAAQDGHCDVVERLVQSGVNVDSRDEDDRTPLHWACENGDVRMVNTLLVLQADLDPEDNVGDTPAFLCRDDKTLIAMIEAGADPKLGSEPMDTLLHHAARHGLCVSISMLAKKLGVDVRNGLHETALHVAAQESTLKSVNELLSAGADPNAQDSIDETPLHRATYSTAVRAIDPEIAEVLIEAGADVNARNMDGETLLHIVPDDPRDRIVELVAILIDAGIDVFAKDDEDNLAVDRFVRADKIREMIMREMQKSIDPSKGDII